MLGISLLAPLLSVGLPTLGIGLGVAAVFALVYVPAIGRALALSLAILSAATFVYDAGFKERAAIAQSEALATQAKANMAEVMRREQAAEAVAKDSAALENAAEAEAKANQEKVTEYEAELAKRPVVPGCDLTDDDVVGLRGIGSGAITVNPPQPPKRPFSFWPLGDSAKAK